MARPKKPKDIRKKYTLSEKQMMKMKQEIAEEAVTKTGFLYLAALADRGWTDEELLDLREEIRRWVSYLDDKLIKIQQVQDMIERKTGMKIKGKW